MKDKVIISASTLILSLLAYRLAKQNRKDAIPYLLWGGFIGSLIGELIVSGTKSTGEYSTFKAIDNL